MGKEKEGLFQNILYRIRRCGSSFKREQKMKDLTREAALEELAVEKRKDAQNL